MCCVTLAAEPPPLRTCDLPAQAREVRPGFLPLCRSGVTRQPRSVVPGSRRRRRRRGPAVRPGPLLRRCGRIITSRIQLFSAERLAYGGMLLICVARGWPAGAADRGAGGEHHHNNCCPTASNASAPHSHSPCRPRRIYCLASASGQPPRGAAGSARGLLASPVGKRAACRAKGGFWQAAQ